MRHIAFGSTGIPQPQTVLSIWATISVFSYFSAVDSHPSPSPITHHPLSGFWGHRRISLVTCRAGLPRDGVRGARPPHPGLGDPFACPPHGCPRVSLPSAWLFLGLWSPLMALLPRFPSGRLRPDELVAAPGGGGCLS